MTPAPGPRHSTALLATVATSGPLLFGYNTGVIAGTLLYICMSPVAGGFGLNEFDEGLVGVTPTPGAALGAVLGGRISDSRGRRPNILLLTEVLTIVTLGCTLPPNIPVLLFFRFILGWAIGGAPATVPIYLSGPAPT